MAKNTPPDSNSEEITENNDAVSGTVEQGDPGDVNEDPGDVNEDPEDVNEDPEDVNEDPEEITDQNGELVDAGILPGSPLSWLDKLLENIQLALAWTPEQKVTLLMVQASERIAEAEVTSVAGQEENADIALNGYNGYSDKITEAGEFMDSIDEESDNFDPEKYQDLQDALAARNASNIQALGTVLEKLIAKSSPAAQRIAVNVALSMKKSLAKYNSDLDEETAAALVVLEAVDEEDVDDQNTEEETQDTAQEDAAVQEDNSGQDLNKGQAKKAASDSDADSDAEVTEGADTDASVTDAEETDDDSQNDNKNKGNGKGGNGKH
jgi:hypothetical protein